MEQFLQQLHEMELFGKIEKGQIGAMLQCLGAVAKDYAKGEFVFLEGESLDSVGVVMSGSVQMIKEDVWGQKAILLSLEPGAVFGESFVCGEALTARFPSRRPRTAGSFCWASTRCCAPAAPPAYFITA